MKTITSIYTMLLLLVVNCAIAQVKTITISNFSDQVKNTFDGGVTITKAETDKSFKLVIPSGLNILSVKIKTRIGLVEKTKTVAGTNHEYTISHPFIELSTGNITIIVCQDAAGLNCRTISLHVDPAVVAAAVIPVDDNCQDLLFDHSDCVLPNKNNKFLIDASVFTDATIYVYDFNPDESLRRWYKVENGGNAEPVNLLKEHFSAKQQVFFKIAGVNRFVYDVVFNQKSIFYESEPSLLFNRMFLGDDTSLGALMDMDGIVAHKTDSEIDKVIKDIKCFNNMYSQIKAEVKRAYDPCNCFSICNQSSFDILIKKLNQINLDISTLELKNSGKKKELEKLKEEEKNCEQNKKLGDEITALAKKKTAKTITEAETAQLAEKTTAKSKLQPCITNDLRAGEIEELENDIAIITNISLVKRHLPEEEDLLAASVFIENMVKQNQSVWKGPLQLEGNFLEFSFFIKKRDYVTQRFGDPQFTDTLGTYKIPIFGRPFVNFSSGSFAAIGRNLQEKTYSWQEVGNNGGYTLTESGYSNPAAGFSAFANLEWKVSRSVGFGPSVGVGITVEEKPKVAYLVGGSLFLGDKHQLAITGGVAFLQVDRISKNFSESAANQVVYAETQNLDYYKEFKAGLFVSLTYTVFNLTKKK